MFLHAGGVGGGAVLGRRDVEVQPLATGTYVRDAVTLGGHGSETTSAAQLWRVGGGGRGLMRGRG